MSKQLITILMDISTVNGGAIGGSGWKGEFHSFQNISKILAEQSGFYRLLIQ